PACDLTILARYTVLARYMVGLTQSRQAKIDECLTYSHLSNFSHVQTLLTSHILPKPSCGEDFKTFHMKDQRVDL
ncbi:MAG: hypothetical protein AAFQ57_15315, partial [Cyanobacteria bacterium J06626_14]